MESFVISKGDQLLNTASLHLQRELAPAELGCRKDKEEKSPDLTRQRKEGKGEGEQSLHCCLHETEPQGPGISLFLKHTAIPQKKTSAFSVFLQSHPETPLTEMIKSKGCTFIRGGFWTESVIARTPSFYI